MSENVQCSRDSGSYSPSLSHSSSSSSFSSSCSFVFKSKRYSRKPDPLSWINTKPVLSQELLLEHANGAVDLGPFAGTIPGFTPLTFLRPGDASPCTTYIHPRQPGSPSLLPQSFQFPSPPTIQSLRPESQATSSIRSFPSMSSASTSVSFPSVALPRRPTSSRENSYNLSLSELILDESASSDEIEMLALESKNAFPPAGRERRRRRKKNHESENQPELPPKDTPELVKPIEESDKDEDLMPTLTPPKIMFSKNSEKTRSTLGITHDCHGKMTTT